MIGPWSDKLDQISGLSLTPTKGHLPLPCLFQSSSSFLVPPEPEQSRCMHYWSLKIDESTHYSPTSWNFQVMLSVPWGIHTRVGHAFFFISAYAMQIMRIDKCISAWNRKEKKRIMYSIYSYADIRTCIKAHICGYAVFILIRIHYADLENICA